MDHGLGIRDSGPWIRDSGFGIRDSGSGFGPPPSPLLSCQVFKVRRSRLGFGIRDFGCRGPYFGIRSSDAGVRVSGSGIRMQGFGFRNPEFGCRGSGFGICDSDVGVRVPEFRIRMSRFGFRSARARPNPRQERSSSLSQINYALHLRRRKLLSPVFWCEFVNFGVK